MSNDRISASVIGRSRVRFYPTLPLLGPNEIVRSGAWKAIPNAKAKRPRRVGFC